MFNANTGLVGIGTNDPTTKLHIETAGTSSILLNEDFEDAQLSLTTGGDASWETQSVNSNSGNVAIQSGAIANSQITFVEETVNIPVDGASVSFFFAVSSELGYDFFKFYIDGNLQDQWSGTINYTQMNYTLDSGQHTLRWAYEKDLSNAFGDDKAYVDDILISTITPAALRIVDGNQGAGKVLTSDDQGNAFWQELPNSNADDIPLIASFGGMEIPICDDILIGEVGSFQVEIKGVDTNVTWEILERITATGTTTNIMGNEVLLAPFNAERLQVRYNFNPPLPFNPNGLIFSANNTSFYPDTFSLNYAFKSANAITMNITRTDKYGDTVGGTVNCWKGQFYFDVLMTN